MAEKEEKIAVAKMLVNTDDAGNAQLDHFKIYSRQEAIERMAKAVGKLWEPVPLKPGDDYDYIWEHGIAEAVKSQWRKEAEAALNALLED